MRDPRVDAYIETLPDWQQTLCREVRELVHGADPEVVETIKRTKLPYFVLQGNVCALLGTKDHVNVFLYDTLVSYPEHIITSGHDNKNEGAAEAPGGGGIEELRKTFAIETDAETLQSLEFEVLIDSELQRTLEGVDE